MDAMDQSRICRKRSLAKIRRTHRIKEIMFGDFHDQRSKVQPARKECNGTRILWEHPEGCLLRVLRERKQADSFFSTVCVKFINTRCIKPAILAPHNRSEGEPLLQCRHTDREQTIYWCNLRKNINFNWFSCSEEKSLTIGRSIFDPIVHEDGGVIAFHFHFHD